MNGISTRIAHGGRAVIPAEHRRALGLGIDDEVIIRLVDGQLRILTHAEAIRRRRSRWQADRIPFRRHAEDEIILALIDFV